MGIDRIKTGWIGAMLALCMLTACGGSDFVAEAPVDVTPPPPPPASAPAPVAKPEVRVFVSEASAAPIAGVKVDVAGVAVATMTAADGSGSVELAAATPVLVKFSKDGYADSFKRVSFGTGSTAGMARVTMLPREAAQSFDAGAGGTLAGKDGASVIVPAGALVDAATGAAASGMVDLAMTPVDVSGDQLRAFPGSFIGVASSGTTELIASYGTTEFAFSQGGRRLNLAPGTTAAIELPIYTPMHMSGVPVVAGDAIPLWSLDEASGIWKQEGEGTVVVSAASPTGLAMRATVGHFSWWNCDSPISKGRVDLDIRLPDVADKDKVDDTRPKDEIDNVETDPNKYRIGPARLVHIDGRTADDSLLRQAGIDFEAAFKDSGNAADRKHALGASYSVASGLVIPADRRVSLSACAEIKRGGPNFAPVTACGTALLTVAPGATIQVTLQLEVGEARDVPYVVIQPRPAAVDIGATATFSVTAIRGFSNDSNGLTYQWTKNGVAIAGATAANYVTPAATSADVGSLYAVVVTSNAGVTMSRYARLLINTPPPPPPPPPPPAPPPNGGTDRWVDAVLGNDANAGTAATPYKTISAAIAVVKSGGTIWLNDGIWTPAIDPGIGPDISVGLNCKGFGVEPLVTGTNILAINPGRVTIRYSSVYGVCVGDTQIRGLRLEAVTNAAGENGSIVASVPGNSLLSGVSFEGGMIVVSNGAKLTIEAAGLTSYGNPGNIVGKALVVFQAGSEVVVNGGAFDALSPVAFNGTGVGLDCAQSASLYAARGGRLVLNQVDLRAGPPRNAATKFAVGIAGCDGSIEINGSTISGFTAGSAAIDTGVALIAARGSLRVTAGSILSANKTGIFASDTDMVFGAFSRIESSTGDGMHLRGRSAGSMRLTMEPGSAVLGSGGNGMFVNGVAGEVSLDIASANLSGNALAGLRMQVVTACRVRDTSFVGNGQSAVHLKTASNCDLGTAASRGGNTFSSVVTNLLVEPSSTDPVFTVLAVGNTWVANQQGADAQGRYAVAPGKTVLEATGPATTGVNYGLGWSNVKLRLAE